METHKILAHIAKEIDKHRSDQASFLASGRAGDYAEYRHVCGVIRGLTFTDQIVKDLVQRMEINEDE